jgi:CHAD domain-containing protein
MPDETKNVITPIGICLHGYMLRQCNAAGRSMGRSRAQLHAGIHEARKAIRRMRAIMDLVPTRVWPDAAPAFTELRNLCRRLSQVRDAHAVVETLDRLLKRSQDADLRALLKRIRARLIKKEAMALDRLLKQDPGLRRFRVRLQHLRDSTATLRWSEIDVTDIRSALARSERRAERAADKAKNTQHGPMRHRWRRRLRRLRHQMMLLETELSWQFIYSASPENRDLISTSQWSAVVRVDAAKVRQTTDALGFEHDLRILRSALQTTSGIKENDRSKVLIHLRHNITHALRRLSRQK